MKISILGTDKSEPEMRLSLRDDQGSVMLVGVDHRGNPWDIASITKDGMVLQTGIGAISGWPLTHSGQLLLIPF